MFHNARDEVISFYNRIDYIINKIIPWAFRTTGRIVELNDKVPCRLFPARPSPIYVLYFMSYCNLLHAGSQAIRVYCSALRGGWNGWANRIHLERFAGPGIELHQLLVAYWSQSHCDPFPCARRPIRCSATRRSPLRWGPSLRCSSRRWFPRWVDPSSTPP